MNPAAIEDTRAQLDAANAKIAQIQALLSQAQNAQQKIQNDLNTLLAFPQSSRNTINQHNANITQCQSTINSVQTTLPSLSADQASALNQLNNAQKAFQLLGQSIANLQKKIPEDQATVANATQRTAQLQALLNQAEKNLTVVSNNKNILDGNVLTLQRQQADANTNLAKMQTEADGLKNKLQSATVSFSLAQNAYDQARVAKQAADEAVNRIIVDNRTTATATSASRTGGSGGPLLIGIRTGQSSLAGVLGSVGGFSNLGGFGNSSISNLGSNAAQTARSLLSGGGGTIGSSTIIPISTVNNYVGGSSSPTSSNSALSSSNTLLRTLTTQPKK